MSVETELRNPANVQIASDSRSVYFDDFAEANVSASATTNGNYCISSTHRAEYDFVQANASISNKCVQVQTSQPEVVIKRDGQPITSSNNTFVVGEKVNLTAEITPSNSNVTYNWINPSNSIKDYTIVCTGPNNPNTSNTTICNNPTSAIKTNLSTSDLNTQNLSFYWWKPGNYQVQVTADTNGISTTATKSFTVIAPSVNVVASKSVVNLGVEFNEDVIRYGNRDSVAGVEFNASVNGTQLNGSYFWVNIYNESKSYRLKTAQGNCSIGSTKTRDGTGVDTSYPYVNGFLFRDSPKLGLVSFMDRATVADSATAWFMFKPSSPDSIEIPLRAIKWSWGGETRLNASGWYEYSNSFYETNPTNYEPKDPNTFQPLAFPEWNKNVKDNVWICQN